MVSAPAVVLVSVMTLAVYFYNKETVRQEAQDAPKILYVLECEGAQEWQAVPAEDLVVSWVEDLKDRLTLSPERPLGEDITIPSWWVHREVQPLLNPLKETEYMDAHGGISLFNVVQAQLLAGAGLVWLPKYLLVLFQMTMVQNSPALEDIHVTASKSFWQTVEATAANQEFIYKADNDTDAQRVPSIAGYAILLPTILSVMYGQGEWPENSVSDRYGDHTGWDREEIIEMLGIFLNITGAISLPDPKEYYWRSDKVALYEVFQRYYEQDPVKHAAPIPTVAFSLPINDTTTQDICYEQRYFKQAKVSDQDIRATAASIIAAALKLDSNADASAIQCHNPQVGNSTVRKYIIKRNHSGFARKVIQLTLDLSNWQPGSSSEGLLRTSPGLHDAALSQQHAHVNQTDSNIQQQGPKCDASQGVCSMDLQNGPLIMSDDPATHAPNDPFLASMDPATDPMQTSMPAAPMDPSLPANDPSLLILNPSLAPLDPAVAPPQEAPANQDTLNPTSTPAHAHVRTPQGGKTSEEGKAAPQMQDRLHDAQGLLAAAERMLREGCGQHWLLQPLIPDMGCNEYRVNLIGGSQANGTATDTAAVFTPAKAANKELYMYNLTLPHGFFSRSPLGATDVLKHADQVDNQCSQGGGGYKEPYFPYLICKEPELHQLLVDVAVGGAQAFIHSQRPADMSHSVLLRIDIALTWHGDQVRPFINEAHYFADATLMFPVWPPEPKSVHIDSHQAAQQQRLQQREQEPQHAQRQQQHTADVPPSKITGWGLWLAEHLWIEVERRVTQKRQHMLAEKFM